MQISAYRVTARRSRQTFECLITPIRDDRSDEVRRGREREGERRRFSPCWTLMATTTRWHRRRWRRERWCGGGRMLGGCCTRPKGSTRMGHGTSPKGRVSTHSCRLPLCHPVCPTVHTYQHVRTHSVDAITGHPPLCSFRPFFSPAFAALSPWFSFSLCPCICVYVRACARLRFLFHSHFRLHSLSFATSCSIFLPCFSFFSSILFYLFLSLLPSLYSWLSLLLFLTLSPLIPSLLPCLHFPR